MLMMTAGNRAPPRVYAEGQVWEYKTRPQDTGSLMMIQRIGSVRVRDGSTNIYHISVVGLKFAARNAPTEIGHLPVSRETLDASVTFLSSQRPIFPDAGPGIAEWRNANGGVFTIPLNQIVETVEGMLARQSQS